jgi:hypothetical protein
MTPTITRTIDGDMHPTMRSPHPRPDARVRRAPLRTFMP